MNHAEQIEALKGLLERVKAAEGPDRILDAEIVAGLTYGRVGVLPGCYWTASQSHQRASFVTASVDAALKLVGRVLPGWWVTSGLCSLSGHASIGPDYNGPDAERLKAEFPPERFDHGGFDADLKPGDGPHRQCLAILACLLSAQSAILTQEVGDDL